MSNHSLTLADVRRPGAFSLVGRAGLAFRALYKAAEFLND